MKNKKKNIKRTDLAILILMPIVAAIISLIFNGNFLVTTLLFFVAPSLYLSFKHKTALKKTFLFSLLFSIPFTFMLDYMLVKNRSWYISNSLFPFRIFDTVALEQFAWGFLWLFLVIIFYEYFFDKPNKKSLLSFFFKRKEVITKRMEYFSIGLFSALIIFILTIFIKPEILIINYFYLIFGVVMGIIPISIFLFKFPNFLVRFLKITAYFLFLAMVVEYVGLELNHWIFLDGHFLGTTSFFGYNIPYEEIIFYFFLSTPGILVYYEFLDDDRR